MRQMHLGSNEKNLLHLFHISKSGITGDIKPVSRKNCDFGSGFYMGEDESDIFSFLDSSKFPDRKFYNVVADLAGLNISNLTFCKWLIFILYNRGYLESYGISNCNMIDTITEYYESSDIISGPIADDSIYEAVELFADGLVSDVFVYRVFTEIKLCKQFVAVSNRACKNLKVTESFPTDSDRKIYDDIRSNRIDNASKVLHSIPSEYKRLGRYIQDYSSAKFKQTSFCDLPDTWVDFSRGDWL